jgi:hypothetical protein
MSEIDTKELDKICCEFAGIEPGYYGQSDLDEAVRGDGHAWSLVSHQRQSRTHCGALRRLRRRAHRRASGRPEGQVSEELLQKNAELAGDRLSLALDNLFNLNNGLPMVTDQVTNLSQKQELFRLERHIRDAIYYLNRTTDRPLNDADIAIFMSGQK